MKTKTQDRTTKFLENLTQFKRFLPKAQGIALLAGVISGNQLFVDSVPKARMLYAATASGSIAETTALTWWEQLSYTEALNIESLEDAVRVNVSSPAGSTAEMLALKAIRKFRAFEFA